MKLSVIIPCYNEVKTIEEIIAAVKNSPYKNKDGRTYDECKKIGLKDGFRGLYCIIKYNVFRK